ncbi:hypothetical protein ACGF0J_08690 [Nonomuraea sp. NPDC047897]|uniref:hypothetical protein n=1 Tax=Nonomuraea sp. NPDC047897 TaxID=3364346 RepID=UPI0037127C7F
MDTSQIPAPNGQPESDRATAEMFYQFAGQAYGSIGYENKTAAELADRSAGELLADAQLSMLQAIYHELRHGHDLAAAQTAALAEHSAALSDHADQMARLGSDLRGHGDALDRHR